MSYGTLGFEREKVDRPQVWLSREKESPVAPGVLLRDNEEDSALWREISDTRV